MENCCSTFEQSIAECSVHVTVMRFFVHAQKFEAEAPDQGGKTRVSQPDMVLASNVRPCSEFFGFTYQRKENSY